MSIYMYKYVISSVVIVTFIFFQLCIINLWDMLAIQLRKQYELTTYAIWKLGFQPKSSVLN